MFLSSVRKVAHSSHAIDFTGEFARIHEGLVAFMNIYLTSDIQSGMTIFFCGILSLRLMIS